MGTATGTLIVYVVAFSAEHVPMGGISIECQPMISCFLQGWRQLRPFCLAHIPSCDLSFVLEVLADHQFEPLELVSDRLLILKMVLLWLCHTCRLFLSALLV